MQAFLVSIASKFFHIQPATAKTKTFLGAFMAFCSCLSGMALMWYNGDQNVLHYITAAGALFLSLGQIFHRDALTKIGNTIGALTK